VLSLAPPAHQQPTHDALLPLGVSLQHVRMLRTFLCLVIAVSAVLVNGCTTQSTRSAEGAGTYQRIEMYFPLSRPNAVDVTDAEWKAFLTQQIVPALPEGVTEIAAQGYFFENGTSKSEAVRILLILTPIEKVASISTRLSAIGRAYTQRFGHDIFLRTDTTNKVTFITVD
jgi:hypothetical protein